MSNPRAQAAAIEFIKSGKPFFFIGMKEETKTTCIAATDTLSLGMMISQVAAGSPQIGNAIAAGLHLAADRIDDGDFPNIKGETNGEAVDIKNGQVHLKKAVK